MKTEWGHQGMTDLNKTYRVQNYSTTTTERYADPRGVTSSNPSRFAAKGPKAEWILAYATRGDWSSRLRTSRARSAAVDTGVSDWR